MKHGHCRGMINLNWICSVASPNPSSETPKRFGEPIKGLGD